MPIPPDSRTFDDTAMREFGDERGSEMLEWESCFVSAASLLGAVGWRLSDAKSRGVRLPPPKGWLEDLLAVAGVGGVEVDAGLDDLIDAVEDRRIERGVGGW